MGPGGAMLQVIAAGAQLPGTAPGYATKAVQILLGTVAYMMNWAKVHNQENALAQVLPPGQLLAFLQAAMGAVGAPDRLLLSRGARRGGLLHALAECSVTGSLSWQPLLRCTRFAVRQESPAMPPRCRDTLLRGSLPVLDCWRDRLGWRIFDADSCAAAGRRLLPHAAV